MKKNNKRVISILLAFSMLGTVTVPVFAAKKEEVIYVLSKADGTINNVYAVSSFDGGNITDYGEYSDLKLLNIDGEIVQNGDKISFSSPENQKVYYQGTIKNAEIPWNISIRYFIDDKELSAKEIAGKSGKLEIKINVTENKNSKKDFFDNYSLQCNFTLDTEICKNIIAEGATIANVGSKKQITYTALGGIGIDRSIKADVTNFEMPSVQINGIKMNLGLDIDFDGDISDLTDGAKKLDDGANKLNDGTAEFNDGVNELNKGIKKLRNGIDKAKDGLSELNEKSSDLKNGSAEVKNALITIQNSLSVVSASTDKLEQLTTASTQIKSGIDSLYAEISKLKKASTYESYKSTMKSNGLDIDALESGNKQAIEQLTTRIKELKALLEQIKSVPQYAAIAEELDKQIVQLETILKLLVGNSAMIGGTETYLNTFSGAVGELEKGAKELKTKYSEFDTAINNLADSLIKMLTDMSKLSSGINTLVNEYNKFDDGVDEYTKGVSKLYNGFTEISDGIKELAKGGISLSDGTKELLKGTDELKDGTGELREKTALLDGNSSEKLNNVIDNITKEYETKSFISDKNKDVSSVQFVIKTEAIEIIETEEAITETVEKLNFWQKLLRLFGLY